MVVFCVVSNTFLNRGQYFPQARELKLAVGRATMKDGTEGLLHVSFRLPFRSELRFPEDLHCHFKNKQNKQKTKQTSLKGRGM